MKLRKELLIAIICLFVWGCQPATQSATPTPFSTLMPQATQAASPTATIALPTPIPTTTPMIGWEPYQKCVKISNQPPVAGQFPGVAVFYQPYLTNEISLLDLNTSVTISLGKHAAYAFISPNRQTLAYPRLDYDTEKWKLVLTDAHGVKQKVVDFHNSWAYWVNDHQIFSRRTENEQVVLELLDPYQGKVERIPLSDFPDLENDFHPIVFLNSSRTMAIYKYQYTTVALFDVSAKKRIAELTDIYDRAPIAEWNPAGEQAAIVGTIDIPGAQYDVYEEIFLVGKDGRPRQATHFYETFQRKITIEGMRWSPDGQKLALWLDDWNYSHNLQLIVLDVNSGEFTNICTGSNPLNNAPIYLPAPHWSPDGKFLLTENRYTEESSRLLIVDLNAGAAFQIAENAFPEGWMDSGQ